MAEIRIEGKTAFAFGDHLYLVYVNDLGQEFVIRGGPESDILPGFSDIVTENGIPIAASEDNRPVEDRADFGSAVLDLDGRDAEDVWKVMVQASTLIGAAGIDYDILGPNSNSTVASVLHTVGIDADAVEPDVPGINFFPGISDDLLDDYVRTFTAAHTSDGNDILVGGNLDDSFEGGGGDDEIDGGDGEADVAVFSGDCSEYDVEKLSDGSIQVTHADGGADGTDTLTNIEFAQFSNFKMDLTQDVLSCEGQDIAFVIDTTGSMYDDIDAVQASASSIIDAVFDAEKGLANSRIAVVGFNDPSTETILSFTDHADPEARKAAAQAAIDSLTTGGGGDFPEYTYSGLLRALDGRAGEWRPEATARKIILFGDATAKDSELASQVYTLAANLNIEVASGLRTAAVAGGLAMTSFMALETDEETGEEVLMPVQIFTVAIGYNAATIAEYEAIAAATGGRAFTAADASEIVDALLEAIETPAGNTMPMAHDDFFLADEEQSISGDLLADNGSGPDMDADGDALTVSLISGPAAGRLMLNEDGSFTYEADADSFDLAAPGDVIQQSFVYQIDDGNGGTDQATAVIDVTILGEGETFEGGNGQQALVGTDGGEDLLLGYNGDDELYGLDGSDTLKGGRGDDLLLGGEGPDFLFGGRGDDTLDGGEGDDALYGGKGDDVLVLASGMGVDVVHDFGVGGDSFQLDGLSFDDLTIAQIGDDAEISAGSEVLAIVAGIDAASLGAADFFVLS